MNALTLSAAAILAGSLTTITMGIGTDGWREMLWLVAASAAFITVTSVESGVE